MNVCVCALCCACTRVCVSDAHFETVCRAYAKVTSARCLRSVSYAEAMELSYFGARVMHPKTMMPW